MFTDLAQKLDGILSKLRNRGKISEKDIEETAREVRRALLEADVNFRVVKDFVARVKERALSEDVIKSFTPAQQIVKVVHEELTGLLGGDSIPFRLKGSQTDVMVVGLQGSGKTTFVAKLGLFLKKQGRKPLLVGLDVYRPAAMDQLEILGKQIDIPVSRGRANESNVKEIYERAQAHARELMCDTRILDTAGRLHIDEEMMGELTDLKKRSKPEEILLVIDSMTGQEAVNVAKAFQERLAITGTVLTKLDGDARGGAALSVTAVTGTKIRFASVGERLGDLELFHADRMAGRILGMGDMLSLIEKAQDGIDGERAQDLEKRLREQTFTLSDFLEELKRLKKMGPLDDILKLVPGFSKAAMKGFKLDEGQFSEVEAIINSMTLEERLHPQLIDGSRRKRIANGSGTRVQAVNRLLKQFQEMKKMMKMFGKNKKMKLPFAPF
ncbi:MAG: signal recognition particle protein [Candidatus Krumholzibacteria bacterium]|nr:signal recognition particle protein [Candidatus Krumholzibacteria bacterium]